MIKPTKTKDFKEDKYDFDATDDQLTKMAMELSNSALEEDWEEEDDDYWSSLLKDNE